VETFTALADPTRRRIVEMLARGPLASGDIARRFAISAPAISQHLKVLKDARLVQMRVDAQRRIYEIDAGGLTEIERWVGSVRKFWAHKLDLLEAQLAQADAAKKPRSKR
jgi:DNA-binding transcriptional ArsR family regulator